MNRDIPNRRLVILLRGNVYLSAALLALGLVWLLLVRDVPLQIGPPIPLSDLVSQLAGANPYALIQLAILILLLTPTAGIVAVTISFAHQGDRTYALLGSLLLALIGLTLLIAALT